MPTPRQWFRDALTDFRTQRTGNQQRAQVRADVAELVNAANEWLSKHDAQENGAKEAFVEARAAQFKTFVEALPPVEAVDADPKP